MKHFIYLALHAITLLFSCLKPGGIKALAAENLVLKQQLLVIRRSRVRAPRLTTADRFIFGWLSMLMNPGRVLKSAIIIKPATILEFHRALVKKKYQRLFGSSKKGKPGPKGPSQELIQLIVEIKQRNPRFGCPQIALLISNRFCIDINKDVVRRVLEKHYHLGPSKGSGPSWLSFIGNTKDSLWSIDLFRCESILIKSHWVLVVMDQWNRNIVGFGVHAGPVDGPTVCRMFNSIISKSRKPKYLSTDNDPLFKFHRWRANLRIQDIDEIKSIPYTPISHPYIERLIGTIRREFLDHTLFWNSADLERKLADFRVYYNDYRVHSSLDGSPPTEFGRIPAKRSGSLIHFPWKSHCNGFFQTPITA